jgi:hypothetical protein
VRTISRRGGAIAGAAMAVVVLFGVVGAEPAQAWGSRRVYRACGNNDIASDASQNSAYTRKHSGSCVSPLGVAMRTSNRWHTRRWGSGTYAGTIGGSGNVGGAHWGCPSCNQSNT